MALDSFRLLIYHLIDKMAKRILATKLDILKFIMERKLVWAYELEEKFGYGPGSVAVRLSRLKKAGLVINMTEGCWELTEVGYSKLRYYEDKEEQEV